MNSFFADNTAATPAEVAAWLNANATFQERAIAYVDEALAGYANAGKLSIRSRGILQKGITGAVTKVTAQRSISIVGTGRRACSPSFDTGLSAYGGSRRRRVGRKHDHRANTDPKADFTDATKITYTLDPVDDLAPGTYMINVEFADAGRGPGNPRRTAIRRLPDAFRRGSHLPGQDGNRREADRRRLHRLSLEQRGDRLRARQSRATTRSSRRRPSISAVAATTTRPARTRRSHTRLAATFGSGHPISKRVHAVHNGSDLNYPTITVAHEETAAFGRNWRITYPMDIRNCESCHSAATTSGTWKTNPNRLACMGCHDTDAATAHMRAQTYDPTPLAPLSGDEQESCKTCH